MKTVGAKEFRLNLDKILDQVLAGEEVIVKHRFKGPVRLRAVGQDDTYYRDYAVGKRLAPDMQALPGLKALKNAQEKSSPYDPKKSLKQLYRETMAQKYGL